MGETKHTPGEWSCGPMHPMAVTGGVLTVYDDQPIQFYAVRARFQDEQDRRCTVSIAHAHITVGREHEAEANARLIAAAPDMLEALRDLTEIDAEELLDSTSETWQRAYAAIAKAEGR